MLDMIEDKRAELVRSCGRHRVERLAVFGSVIRDDFDAARSDLDFAVRFAPMGPRDHAEAYFGLLEDLEGLFGRRVDLVEIAAVRNPYLRREIEEQQETLYAAA